MESKVCFPRNINDIMVHTISNTKPHDHNDTRKLMLQTPKGK